MATLRIQVPGVGTKVYHIYKKITSLGKGDEVDVVLPDPLLADTHAHIHFDGRDFNIAVVEKDAEIHVNGRRRTKHRLAQEDRIRIGSAELEFSLSDAQFKNALSVMNLKLTSVMCVPLLERGNLIGVIYVGNDNVRQLFDESSLELLTIFAAQASL